MAAAESYKLFFKHSSRRISLNDKRLKKVNILSYIFGKKNTMSNIFKQIEFSAKNLWQKKHIKLYNKSVILWKRYMENFNL